MAGDVVASARAGGARSWSRRPRRAPVVALLAALLLALGASAAGAQEEPPDPYGATSTTEAPPSADPTCDIGLTVASPGQSLTATVALVPLGATVTILVDGIEVGRATAPVTAQAAGAPVLLGGVAVAAQAETTTVSVPIVLPSDLSPGLHLVTAVGADFTVVCGPNADGMLEVLAAADESVGGESVLPRTGIAVALLIALALAAILIGRALVAASRRRRAAAAADRPGTADDPRAGSLTGDRRE